MQTVTRIVLLMHTKEFRYQKCTTGRLTVLNLANSEIIPGVDFEEHPRFRALADDPQNYPVLLYPGQGAMDVGRGELTAALPAHRRLVVFIVDATWHCSRKVVRLSPTLQRLPRISLTPQTPSRYTIKRQPSPWCLSTLEATHELLLALELCGLDAYPDKERLIAAFHGMQDFQVRQINSARTRAGYRVRGKREPLAPEGGGPEPPLI